jgi:hypothetical protein
LLLEMEKRPPQGEFVVLVDRAGDGEMLNAKC